MIITYLIGGMGNQMFQYAIAKNLAVKNNTEIYVDNRGFGTYNLHNYSLNLFNITGKCEIPNAQKIQHVNEKDFQFDPTILNLKGNIRLKGYWQSEKYFKDIKDIIKKDFSLKQKPELQEHKINKTNSVSLHVRRKDYLTDKRTNAVHGVLPITYYNNAVDYIKSKVDSPHFFVFSDDIEWCKQNFKYPNMDFIEGNTHEIDFELLKKCKHNIIANSTFAWWGAWLNYNDNIVIAPKQWFQSHYNKWDDLIPENWIQL